MKKVLALVLAMVVVTAFLCSCSHAYASTDLMEGYNAEEVDCGNALSQVGNLTEFACNLLKNAVDTEKSTLVSPVSVLYALAMTANGAKGETLAEIESVLGMDVDTLNKALYAYSKQIAKTDEVQLANAIWFKDDNDFTVNTDFLQTNANYYNAGAYKGAFDKSTLDDINAYVKEHTNGQIKNILDEIPSEAVMYLVNALAFESKWQDKFGSSSDGTFVTKNGTVTLKFMQGDAAYIGDNTCIGAVKNYKDCKYSFVALMPTIVSLDSFVQTLTAERLQNLIANRPCGANLSMPKFSTDYNVLLNTALQKTGISLAFHPQLANLTGLGTVVPPYNLVISRVLHKTHLEVDNEGTKASAATLFEVQKAMAPAPILPPKDVVLDHPFVYAIWDNANNLPIFLGTYVGD